MHIVTFFNHAGGVGKTSSVRDIGYQLQRLGMRVLLVDLDPQANLSTSLGLQTGEQPLTEQDTLLDALTQPLPAAGAIAVPSLRSAYGMHIWPSHLGLARAELLMPGDPFSVQRLQMILQPLQQQFDIALIDSPPSLGVLTRAALFAADAVVVPVPPVSKGMESLGTVLNLVGTMQNYNPRLRVALFLVTQFQGRLLLTQHLMEQLRSTVGQMTAVSTPLNFYPAVYNYAYNQAMPIAAYVEQYKSDGGQKASVEIATVTQELLAALGVVADV